MKLVGAKFKVGGKDAGEVRLEPSGEVTIRVKNALVQRELENGVLGPKKQFVKAAEGLKFIQAVIRQYSGAYVQAVGIIE
jgi:hypothetical protein